MLLVKCFPPACRMLHNFLLECQLLSHFDVQQTSQMQHICSSELFLDISLEKKLHQKNCNCWQ